MGPLWLRRLEEAIGRGRKRERRRRQGTLPVDPLLSLPSRLVEQRPYIKPHEALLHAATAEVPHLRRWRIANHWGREDSRMIQLSREVARR